LEVTLISFFGVRKWSKEYLFFKSSEFVSSSEFMLVRFINKTHITIIFLYLTINNKNFAMRKLLLFSFLLFFTYSCDDNSEDNSPISYSIEGKWLWSPDPNDRSRANTMYEFENGIRYTSYANCFPQLCTNKDFNALNSSNRIPGTKTYTFDGKTLIIDNTSQEVTFDCNGGILLLSNGGKFWRLSSECN